ncbi:MAG: hypothetical protein HUJ91_05775 [Bacteroidales bacterium]|nr:hypothetical protein [Bacteroidales bacterium]
MKKIIVLLAVLAAPLFTSCITYESSDFMYTLSYSTATETDLYSFLDVLRYLEKVGYKPNDYKIYNGSSPSKFDKEAKEWFESIVKNINEAEFCALMYEGEYCNPYVYRLDDNGKQVIVAEREFKGTKKE